ncbi:MAG: hypothetical protein CM15mP84_01780 [Cellvibrionales bacterium]|nr:MAG: hypothetical protein CM15mP84_01780 [Cellvibrionales bacterium]
MFEEWYAEQTAENIDALITIPESESPTFIAFNRTEQCDAVLQKWFDYTKPRLEGIADKYRAMDYKSASAQELYDAICDMAIEEGDTGLTTPVTPLASQNQLMTSFKLFCERHCLTTISLVVSF